MSKEESKKLQAPPSSAPFSEKAKFWLLDTGKQLLIAALIVLVLRYSFVEPYKIPSGSMIPTLFVGDHIFVNKFSYGFKVPFGRLFRENDTYITERTYPKRGDVIVFRYPNDESLSYIKRVVGLPGDTVVLRNKILYINDQPVKEEPFEDPDMFAGIEDERDRSALKLYMANMDEKKHPVLHDILNTSSGADYGPRKIPDGKIFVMGDNRERSSDSRMWGLVPLENVKGRAMFIWLNFFVHFKPDFKVNFRVSRIGKLIR